MKGILRKKRFWVILALVALGGAIGWRLWPRQYDLTVSYETTRLLGPLNADGTVNYVAASNEMYGQGVTPDNNAAVLLLQAMGPEALYPPVRARTFELLGMDPLRAEGDYFVRLDDYAKAKLSPAGDEEEYALWEEMDARRAKAMAAPWSAKDDPQLADWLKSIAGPLDLITAASRRPRYHFPMVSQSKPPQLLDAPIPSFRKLRDAARALTARAMLRAGQARCDQAVPDLLTAHRLARLIAQGPWVIEKLVGLAIESPASEGSAALAGSGKLSADDAKAFLAELEALPPLASVVESIDRGERFCSLDIVATLARWQWSDKPGSSELSHDDELSKVNTDWNQVCKKFNYWYDMHVAAMRTEPYSVRKQALAKYRNAFGGYAAKVVGAQSQRPAWLEKLFGPGPSALERDPVNALVWMFMPSLSRSRLLYDRSVVQFRLLKVAVALAAYRAQTGQYPEKLDELAPKYFKEVPTDLFAEGPLKYRRTAKGYLLYSVGENQQDDGGVHEFAEGDIVISVGQPRRTPQDEPATTRPAGQGTRVPPG